MSDPIPAIPVPVEQPERPTRWAIIDRSGFGCVTTEESVARENVRGHGDAMFILPGTAECKRLAERERLRQAVIDAAMNFTFGRSDEEDHNATKIYAACRELHKFLH